jgi:hypothetical protein
MLWREPEQELVAGLGSSTTTRPPQISRSADDARPDGDDGDSTTPPAGGMPGGGVGCGGMANANRRHGLRLDGVDLVAGADLNFVHFSCTASGEAGHRT